MKKYVCKKDMCTGCKACIDTCKMNAIYIKDTLDSLNAVIDTEKCINCKQCYKVCPNNGTVELKEQLSWYQGWAQSEDERKNSSSGGFATILAKEFVKDGGFVASCTFEQGDFVFKIAKTDKEIECFRGSKYVKSNPQGIYHKIKQLLEIRKKVLFIGLPCQVAAVKKFVGTQLEDNLYTVDLICHGTPSKKLFDTYLEDYHIEISEVKNVSFREKNSFLLKIDDKPVIHYKIQDEYLTTFLLGLNYTGNCYNCKYAINTRVGDITIGDSWGSELSIEEINKGISLILCQTEKGKALLERLPFHLESVDLKKARNNNRQLNHPTIMPNEREYFFKQIKKGKKYSYVVARLYPKAFVKRSIKRIIYMLENNRKKKL